jgi:superfamily II RNA helicase
MVKQCIESYPEYSAYTEYFEQYPFPLSDFQKWAIEGIASGNHTLVTAHTGSGKTLPAEFAIRHFVGMGKKVIYTAPIKALSNQKYYDFTQKFPDITFGLMTGDIKTNPTADVLIMTTEILQNYLFLQDGDAYKGGLQFQIDIANDLACVVFDEVHYINDAERGQVWEKTILMLPRHIQMVMLSATIDAPHHFAEWIEARYTGDSTKIVYLASTSHRVVPLTHYGFITTIEGIFKGMKDKVLEAQIRDHTNKPLLLQTATGGFQEATFYQMKSLMDVFDKKQVRVKRKHLLNQLILTLRDREMLPAIAFVFSRKHVEMCAQEITVPILEDDSKVPYIVARECETILRKLPNFQEYLKLPEYISLIALLEKGIAIHHSGMLPILREMVELAISKKYVKLLFATESFAIGLDCPIKTAIFTSLTKFDGHTERTLYAHEYTQMAGRAGRRGIDTVGNVIHCNQLFDLPSLHDYKTILGGKPQKLVSKFFISFSLVLNLCKRGYTRDFHLFAQKSMMFSEICEAISFQRKSVSSKQAELDAKKGALYTSLTTPFPLCLEYIELEHGMKTAVNKRRKEIQRRFQEIQDAHRFCARDVSQVRKLKEMEHEFEKEQSHLAYLETYLENAIRAIVFILEKRGFIQPVDLYPDEYQLTYPLGTVAANLAEIPGHIFAELLIQWNYFEGATVKQMVGILASISDIKVSEEIRVSTPNQIADNYVKSRIQEVVRLYDQYAGIETDHEISSGTKYEGFLVFDMVDEMMEWCDLESEGQCREFTDRILLEKGVSLGEFTKTLLKINAIAKEIAAVLPPNETETLKRMREIEGHILKYIVTTQSLYI